MTPRPEAQDRWTAQLRSHGCKLTVQRHLVLQALDRLGRGTPEDITQAVREITPSLNASTVYRTLELFEKLGMVRHSHIGHGAASYSLATARPPVNLVCARCEQVLEAHSDVLGRAANRIEELHGFTVDVGHVTLTGVCGRCRSVQRDP